MSPKLVTVEVAVGTDRNERMELRRAGVLARVAAATLTLGAAAELMAVSYRQAKRLYRRYRTQGRPGCATAAPAGRRTG